MSPKIFFSAAKAGFCGVRAYLARRGRSSSRRARCPRRWTPSSDTRRCRGPTRHAAAASAGPRRPQPRRTRGRREPPARRCCHRGCKQCKTNSRNETWLNIHQLGQGKVASHSERLTGTTRCGYHRCRPRRRSGRRPCRPPWPRARRATAGGRPRSPRSLQQGEAGRVSRVHARRSQGGAVPDELPHLSSYRCTGLHG